MPEPRPTSPRIEPVTNFDGGLAGISDATLTHDRQPLNMFGTPGHRPELLERFNTTLGSVAS